MSSNVENKVNSLCVQLKQLRNEIQNKLNNQTQIKQEINNIENTIENELCLNVETNDNDIQTGPFILKNNDSLRFMSNGSVSITGTQGSANISLNPNNILTSNGPPVNAPLDLSIPSIYFDQLTNELYYSIGSTWIKITQNTTMSGICTVGTSANAVADGCKYVHVIDSFTDNSPVSLTQPLTIYIETGVRYTRNSNINFESTSLTIEGGGTESIFVIDNTEKIFTTNGESKLNLVNCQIELGKLLVN